VCPVRNAAVSGLLLVAIACAQSAETLLDQGIDQFHKGQYSAALQSFDQAVKLSPADARAITYRDLVRAAMGDCRGTFEELKLQSGRNPDSDVRRLAGLAVVRCLLPANRINEALTLVSQLRSAFPDDPDVLYESSMVYNRAWNYSVVELLEKAPDSYRASQLTAEVHEAQGHYADAVAEYRKAIDRNPIALTLHYRLGRALLLLSRENDSLEKARQEFEAELKLNPSDASAEYQIGQVLSWQNKSTDAEAHLEKAVSIAPHFAEALVALAKIHENAQENDEAIQLLRRAVDAQPGMEAAHTALIAAYRAAGKRREAEREQKELDKLKKATDKAAPKQ
jgi:tetratricopeptide (TPR) repeat protein